jgi:hypothetical protein
MTTTDKIEYYKKLLELERLTLASVTEQRNETSHNLASIVAAILKRDGRDVFDMSAIDRLAELHTAERQRDEAVNDYETAVLREHRVQEQRDEFRGLLIELYNDINVIHSGKAVSKLNKLFRDENYN